MTVPEIKLHDGHTIPQLGFGVFQVPPEDTADVVTRALEVGYRHIDTAEMYGNEAGVGEAIKSSGIPREELFITSKLNNQFHEPEAARKAFGETLDKLGLDQIDLFLIHWPLPTRYDGDFVSTWKTLLEFVENGRAASVGVSNFQPDHLDRIVEETGVAPVINQIEVHPFFTNEAARAANQRHDVRTEGWAPIAKGKVNEDDTIRSIAEQVGRTPAQVALRWAIQRGDIVFPKSTHTERMRENFDLFDFELSDEQVKEISGLDRGEEGRTGPNPDAMDWIPS
jgi:2,5-diketo-D-gluconate reductase A